jgi:predicted site-specific integrase-resolvase
MSIPMLMTTQQVCEVLGVNIKTLNSWRVSGKGPKFCKLSGRSIKYLETDVTAYVLNSVRSSTSEQAPKMEKIR